MRIQASQKGLSLRCEISPDIPREVTGDPARLRQILVNLLGNALKFTPAGSVLVQRHAGIERRRTRCRMRFSVIDTGIGIPKEKQSVIFQPFAQADGSMTRKYGGTGLGLSISMRLVELMGGRMWVASEPGKGSAFHFSIRFLRPEAEHRLRRGMPVGFGTRCRPWVAAAGPVTSLTEKFLAAPSLVFPFTCVNSTSCRWCTASNS